MRSRRSPLAIALVVLIGGLVTSVVASAVWRAVLRDDASTSFTGAATEVEDDLAARLDALAVAARSTRTELADGDDPVTQRSFERAAATATADLDPGDAASVVYVQPASGTVALDELRAEVQARGVPGFDVNNPTGGDEHLVATFEAPSQSVPVFDGLDLATVPATRAALDGARVEGRAVLSDTLEMLPRATARAYPSLRQSGVAVAVPVYRGATTPTTPTGRIEGLQGWVVVVSSAQDLLEAAVAPTGGELAAQLEDLGDPDAPGPSTPEAGPVLVASTTLADGGPVQALDGADPDTTAEASVERLGQSWALTVVDVDGFGGATTREPLWILAGGATLSVLLAALVWSLASTRASALAMAAAATEEVRRTEARFRALVHNLPDLIVVTDDERTISFVSPSVTALLGWTSEEALGAVLATVVHPDDRARFEQALTQAAGGASIEIRVLANDGQYRWFEGAVTNLYDDPAVEGLVITAHDITAQKAVEDRLAHEATHDPLTHLPNRVIVNDRLGHALERGRRDGSRAAAIFLDIDEFKQVNDRWGHAAGDELLREVAVRVQRAARSADTVGRYGGDEFVVICENLPSAADALVVAERIRDEVARPASVDGAEVLVGTSIGVALSMDADETTRDLIGRADAAMYEAKSKGRGRIVIDTEATAGLGD
ncbi:MAG: diguanylate cyclase [Acidimicrobiales bacterium]|nr:diguanylate cyclase [Acidimicrobiales bacterium]